MGDVLGHAKSENFPVAPFFVPAQMRRGLMAVYGFARLVDDIGDNALSNAADTARILGIPTDPSEVCAGTGPTLSLALLDAVANDLRSGVGASASTDRTHYPRHLLIRRLSSVIEENELTVEPFYDLIEANRREQQQTVRFHSYQQLVEHCTLSAVPVGRVVLELAGKDTPERIAYSDSICTGLQIIDHLQDVAEDIGRDRVYLPMADLELFGVVEQDLTATSTSGPLRELIAFQARRARALLMDGAPLVGSVSGRFRALVAGFVGGGRAALDELAASGYDVLAGPSKARTISMLRPAAVAWARGR